jgi:hypothetical protein
MKMAVIVPIMGGLHESKSFWGCIVAAGLESDLIVFDNGANIQENQENFFKNYIFPQMPYPERCHYWPQQDNLGMVQTMQYCYEKTDYDVLCFIHNDLYIYDHNWDQDVLDVFVGSKKPGLVGVFGAKGVLQNSGRFHVWNNMVEAEIHGYRLVSGHPSINVAVLDGMFMAASRKMLDVRGGVDTTFDIHHYYDLDLSLESIERGFDNYIVPLYVHHVSGQTACKPAFQDWASEREGKKRGMEQPMPRAEYEVYYRENLERFVQKWGGKLPYHVDKGWSTIIHG